MGQQQLLLLVLGIVIVGLAVVVGINAFGENQKRTNADALINDALRISSDIQAHALKPPQFGGTGGWPNLEIGTSSAAFLGDQLGYPIEGTDDYNNVNGTYIVSGSGADGVLIVGFNPDQNNTVAISVCGVTSRDINTEINFDGGADGDHGGVDCPEDPTES